MRLLALVAVFGLVAAWRSLPASSPGPPSSLRVLDPSRRRGWPWPFIYRVFFLFAFFDMYHTHFLPARSMVLR